MQGTKKMRSTRKIIIDNARNAARPERRARKGCLEAREGVGERGTAVRADQNPLKGSSLMYSSSPAVLLPL